MHVVKVVVAAVHIVVPVRVQLDLDLKDNVPLAAFAHLGAAGKRGLPLRHYTYDCRVVKKCHVTQHPFDGNPIFSIFFFFPFLFGTGLQV